MVKARKYIVTKRFDGWPKTEDFEIIEYELPPLNDGEILVKVEWISVDPYLRVMNGNNFKINALFFPAELPYNQIGYNVGIVLESKEPNYPIGTKVVSHEGWQDYYVAYASKDYKKAIAQQGIYKLPDLQELPDSFGIGAMGMPGAAAYFGFLEICQPKAGETVVVTCAAGATGSLVGQIAKIKGCRVIGFTDSDKKTEWLVHELGFDKAYNYNTVNVTEALADSAPEGIDCYFDNVGGEQSASIMNQMNNFGRVAVSGMISCYNNVPGDIPLARLVQPVIVMKQLTVQGFIVFRWSDRWFEAFAQLLKWIKNGQLKVREHVTEGFENMTDAFIGMMHGDNFGKAVVKL